MVGYKISMTDKEKYKWAYQSKNSIAGLYQNQGKDVCPKFYKPYHEKKLNSNRLRSAKLRKDGFYYGK